MSTTIAAQITPQGLLIPQSAIREWLEQGIEVTKERRRIVIQPRPAPRTERERVLHTLESAGLLLPAESLPPGVSLREPDGRLEYMFSVGRPLSEVIIEEREERW